MGAGHSHGAGHAHGGTAGVQNRRRLAITLGLVVAYMVAEVIGGLITNSLALLADARHMLSDAGALAFSLFAIWIAQKPRNGDGRSLPTDPPARTLGGAADGLPVAERADGTTPVAQAPDVLSALEILLEKGRVPC